MSPRAERFDQLREPQKRGQAAEAIIQSELVVRDLSLLLPAYDNDPYDFVVELADQFYRLQAKTAYRSKEGTVNFETVSTRTRASGYDRRGYDDLIDYFVVYNPVTDDVYMVHVEEAAAGKMEIRFEPARNGQTTGVNWHEAFLLDTVLDELQN